MAGEKYFCVADLNSRGELRARTDYAYDLLEQLPGAAVMIAQFSTCLWREPEGFQTQAPPAPRITLRWRAVAPTAGIATIRCREDLVSVSLLCSGLDAQADQLTLEAFQQHLLHQLRDTDIEPAFALMELHSRPLVATVNFLDPADERERVVAALSDRCFAASYFRYHGLA
jgi:hypothetical protein